MIKNRKAKWVPFCRPCQGLPLSKHTTCNRVSAGLLGRGRRGAVKEQKALWEWGT